MCYVLLLSYTFDAFHEAFSCNSSSLFMIRDGFVVWFSVSNCLDARNVEKILKLHQQCKTSMGWSWMLRVWKIWMRVWTITWAWKSFKETINTIVSRVQLELMLPVALSCGHYLLSLIFSSSVVFSFQRCLLIWFILLSSFVSFKRITTCPISKNI